MSIISYKTKKGKARYKVQLWSNNRRVATKTFDRKADALEWQNRKKLQITDAIVGREKGTNLPLNHFFYEIYWPNRSIRAGTSTDYLRIFKSYVEPDLGKRLMTNITEEDWALLFQKLKRKGKSEARINRIHASISAVMSFAVKWKYLFSNPLKLVPYHKEKIKRFDYWTKEEVETFLRWAKNSQCPRFGLYHTTYELGLRMEEIVALTRDCFNFSRGHVHIRQSYCKASKQFLPLTKSGHERILGLNHGLQETIQSLIRSHDQEFLFLNNKGERITHDALRHHFRKDQEAAQVRTIRFHDIRHTFASHFMMQGGNIYDLKALLGHADISTTMRYAHLSPDHLKKQASLVSFNNDHSQDEESNVIPLNRIRSISALAPQKRI